jgi:hypothetical protein
MTNMNDGSSGIINIHGKSYRTVALRVNLFRESLPLTTGWGIHSEIVHQDAEKVIMRAWVTDPEGRIIGTGYAEEVRKASKINATSALENCETSAIGRALAACGYGGEEYASANEVQGAIASQEEMAQDGLQKALEAIEKGDWLACCLMDRGDDPMWLEAWKKMSSKHRAAFKELQKARDEYRNGLNTLAGEDDEPGFAQLNNELTQEQARYIYRLLTPEAQTMMTNMRSEKEAA